MAVQIDIGFDADEFMALPPDGRIRVCLILAERAQNLAKAAQPGFQRHYLRIAQEWLSLADAMQRALAEEEQRIRAH